MTYFRLAAVSLLLLCSQLTFADSIKTYLVTSISMQMSPNDGSGDNISFTFSGPQFQMSGIGGMGCFDWCSDQPIFGTPVVSPSQVFISSISDPVVIDGVSYSGFDTGFDPPGLFDDFGGVYRFVSGSTGEGDSFTQFNLILPTNGKWIATFTFIPPSGDVPGYYEFNNATFEAAVPEPGTITLTLTGLAGIAGLVKRKIRSL
jgi:hypothetical protein